VNSISEQLRYEYPEELVPRGLRPIEHSAQLSWQGAGGAISAGCTGAKSTAGAAELQLIEDLQYEAYFLTVYDLVSLHVSGNFVSGAGFSGQFSRFVFVWVSHRWIRCGLMCCLSDLSVGSGERAPDIDVDFEHERREEVLQYIFRTLWSRASGMTVAVISYRTAIGNS
jgi:error-prone DNA polymerase